MNQREELQLKIMMDKLKNNLKCIKNIENTQKEVIFTTTVERSKSTKTMSEKHKKDKTKIIINHSDFHYMLKTHDSDLDNHNGKLNLLSFENFNLSIMEIFSNYYMTEHHI